ncbi:aryl hydrocarbon receptor nuclear translocator 2-like [Styela clava]|uniref:aryl hydrocarbon receptor nuclear translocator-like n=1 Tax=Styela clava TaxID=7725 RepID=UPI0019396AB9|nr:aryl hydrocarbon receptor nuclear translocator-like [Styela clava]XP_039254498.1 aryl hydrocarbon receptor nuclear translocator-like [Styela clava]
MDPGKDQNMDDMSQADKERFARENHSEIERRRRNKMTAYITELSDMVPSCSALARKPDKLTILRMAVSHMKQLRVGMAGGGLDSAYKPAFLTDQELKHLVLESADGFLFVASCETGQVIYVSDTVTSVLSQAHSDWLGHSLYDLIHPQDVAKVQEQLNLNDTQNTGRMLDLKTGTVKKEGQQSSVRMCNGSRRAFICRMRCGKVQVNTNGPRYQRARNTLGHTGDGEDMHTVTHVTGYIKPWPPSGYTGADAQPDVLEDMAGQNSNGNTDYCLVAIARLQITSHPTFGDLNPTSDATEFVSRHNFDNVYTFVDMRVTSILGYQPQDLLGKRPVDFYHPDDAEQAQESFKQVMLLRGQVFSMVYRFRAQNGEYIWMRTSTFTFQNPYNNEVEYIVCTNSLMKQNQSQQQSAPTSLQEDQVQDQKGMPGGYGHVRSDQQYGNKPTQSPDVQSPTTTLNYPPQNIATASAQIPSQFSPTTVPIAQPGWNPVGVGAADPVSSQYSQALLDRYQAPVAPQQQHGGMYTNASYQASPPIGGYVADGRPTEAYPQSETMMSMLEQGPNAYNQEEFTELNMFTPFSQS